MRSRQIKFTVPFICLISIFFISTGVSKPPVNKDAQAIAKVIPAYKPGGNQQTAAKQMTHLISLLSRTKRNSVSSNSALLKKAMDFRNDIGSQQKSVTIGAILNAWSTAYDLGAINIGHHFTGRATKGRYAGKKLVFENIVARDMLPEAAGYIGNIRIVPEPLARKKGAPADLRDQANATGIKKVISESQSRSRMLNVQKSKVGDLALNKAGHEARWRKEVEATGEAYKQRPYLRLLGQRVSSPSKMNGNIYKMRVEVINLSRHPTEVEIESTIVGYTEKNNRIYEMRKDRRTVKLRRSEVHEYEIKTPNVSIFATSLQGIDPLPLVKGRIQPQPVIYRGYTIVARYNGEGIHSIGSDRRMTNVVTGEYSAPAVVNKTSRAGSIAKSTPLTILKSYQLMQFNSPAELVAGKNGTIVSPGRINTVGLMADKERMYRLDTDGKLTVYKSASFDAPSVIMGRVFAGINVRSLWSDGTHYYLHLKETSGRYEKNDVVKFSSVRNLISGDDGTVINQAAPGSAAFMADGKSFYKINQASASPALLRSRNLNQLVINREFATEGNLFCGNRHAGIFADGKHYYIQVAEATEE